MFPGAQQLRNADCRDVIRRKLLIINTNDRQNKSKNTCILISLRVFLDAKSILGKSDRTFCTSDTQEVVL